MARGRKKKENDIEDNIIINEYDKYIKFIKNELIKEYIIDLSDNYTQKQIALGIQSVLRITLTGVMDERTITLLNLKKGLLPRLKEHFK